MSIMDLSGKNAIITGATKGIGRGIANGLAEAGANIVVVSRNKADCERVAEEIKQTYGVKTLALPSDVTKQSDIQNMVDRTVETLGSIDILVNNAGSAITKRAEDLTEEDWDHVMNLDLKAVFFCSQAVGRQMIAQKHGKIINIGSVLALVSDKQVLPYSVAKGGVLQMTKALALEWAKHNIQVNAICPGYIVTEINREALQDERISSSRLRKITMRRFGEVDEVAGAAVYLASNASSYVTGSHILVDGGWCAE